MRLKAAEARLGRQGNWLLNQVRLPCAVMFLSLNHDNPMLCCLTQNNIAVDDISLSVLGNRLYFTNVSVIEVPAFLLVVIGHIPNGLMRGFVLEEKENSSLMGVIG